LRSIGLTSLLGIGYSIIGAYFILPLLMKKIFTSVRYPAGNVTIGSPEHTRRTILRYRHLPAHPRLFARFKIMIDPMFNELQRYVQNPAGLSISVAATVYLPPGFWKFIRRRKCMAWSRMNTGYS